MNPQAIMTPGGIADQLTNGLSGVAMAFQRAREQRERREQAELENSRADSYLRIAQQNAQTGASNHRYNVDRQGRLDQEDAANNVLERHYKQQEDVRRQGQFEMDQVKAARNSGYGAAQGFGELAGMPATRGPVGQLMPGDRYPEQNRMWRNDERLNADEFSLKRDALAEKMRLTSDKAKYSRNPKFNPVYSARLRASATPMDDAQVAALTPYPDRATAISMGMSLSQLTNPADPETALRETMAILDREDTERGQAPPPAALGAQGALPVPGAPAWLDSLDAKTR